MKNLTYLLFGLILPFLFSCNAEKNTIEPEYLAEIENWRERRVNNLTSANGWIALAGLFWLEEGDNTFGSGKDNQLIFPERAPEKMGSFYLDADSVVIKILPEIEVMVEEAPISEMTLVPDITGSPTILHHHSLNWNLIQRGDRFGIRLRDTLHEARQNFEGIDYFEIDPAWKLAATFEPYEGGKEMKFKNVLDMETDQTIEGALKFEIEGKSYSLDVLDGGPDDFFVIFADETTGDNTYGGGRYLYTPRPKEGQVTEIDFNKAYTPPCGFTDFATCLLPPAQNRLAIAIMAGEEYHGEH